jgi:hypothetical protein
MPFAFFDSTENLVSFGNPTVASPGAFTRYTGSYTSSDDGFTSSPIALPSGMNWQYGTLANAQATFTQFYVSTNGYISFSAGSGGINSSPTAGTIAGNPGDLWLQTSITNTSNTTTVHDIFTRAVSFTHTKNGVSDPNGAHYFMDIVVYCGTYGATTTGKDYQIRLLKYAGTQWVQIRTRSLGGIAGNQGVFGTVSGSSASASSQVSKVWESSNGGQNWTFRGTGGVGEIGPGFTTGAYADSGGVSLSKVIDNLEFGVGNQVNLAGTGYSWWNHYNSRAGAQGSEFLLGCSFMNIGAIRDCILRYVVGATTATENSWLLNTTYGGYAGDINGDGSLPDLSDSTRLGNIQAGAAGCQALTDAPVVKLLNLMRLSMLPEYSEHLRIRGIVGGISLNNLRPGYPVYDTASTRVVSNAENTGVEGKTRLYSVFINGGYMSVTPGTQVSMSDHVGTARARSIRGVGATIRGTGGALP